MLAVAIAMVALIVVVVTLVLTAVLHLMSSNWNCTREWLRLTPSHTHEDACIGNGMDSKSSSQLKVLLSLSYSKCFITKTKFEFQNN